MPAHRTASTQKVVRTLYRVVLTYDDGSENVTYTNTQGSARGMAYRFASKGAIPARRLVPAAR